MFLDLKDQSDFSHHLMFMVHDKGDAEKEKMLGLVPKELWACNSTKIGTMHSTSSVKTTMGQNTPLPNIRQYPLKQKVIETMKPLVSAYINKGLIMPCTCPCNTPIVPVEKPNGKGWGFVQDLRSINAIVIPCHSVVGT